MDGFSLRCCEERAGWNGHGETDRRSGRDAIRADSDDGVFQYLRRSEEHTSELQSQSNLVCRLLLEKKKKKKYIALESTHNNSPVQILTRFSTLLYTIFLPYFAMLSRRECSYHAHSRIARHICPSQA